MKSVILIIIVILMTIMEYISNDIINIISNNVY